MLLRPFLLEFAALRAAVENQETKAQRTKELAFAGPGIGLGAGRRSEPVTGEEKGIAQHRERGIAGVIISVEAEISARCRRLLRKSGHNKQETEKKSGGSDGESLFVRASEGELQHSSQGISLAFLYSKKQIGARSGSRTPHGE